MYILWVLGKTFRRGDVTATVIVMGGPIFGLAQGRDPGFGDETRRRNAGLPLGAPRFLVRTGKDLVG